MADEYFLDEFTISTDRARLDLDVIHGFLANSYWSPGIQRDVVEQSIQHSFCFGLYWQSKQIGFARVITDFNAVAYLADVFVVKEFQCRGLGKWLVKTIVDHPRLQSIRRFLLFTQDAHGLYAQFNFEPLENSQSCMQIYSSAAIVDTRTWRLTSKWARSSSRSNRSS